MSIEEKIKHLSGRLQRLEILHRRNTAEIESLRRQILELQQSTQGKAEFKQPVDPKVTKIPDEEFVPDRQELPEVTIDFSETPSSEQKVSRPEVKKRSFSEKQSSIEQFIGGNLINKIGILILIFGIGYLVKYAIDNGYFPPLVRFILSFVAGLVLVILGYRLKPKYKTYSAVLFSGGMAVLYFTAYGGNAFFDPVLLPQLTSFILMVVFTIVTVAAATIYDLEIIGLLGLVGAYAVPFLMGDPEGDYRLLLSYVAVINTGVLALSLRKLWKGLIIAAFVFTWLIFSFWWATESAFPEDASMAWLFSLLYFGLFYGSLIGYNLLNKKPFSVWNIVLIILNAFIFFGLGMSFLEDAGQEHLQGLFTLGNGIIHLGMSAVMYYKVEDKKLFYVIGGLFWTFVTIAVPVQFEGDVVQILWMAEAVILFYLARKFLISLYEILAYIVMGISCIILFDQWVTHYYDERLDFRFLFNPHFLTTMLTLGGLAMLNWIHFKKPIEGKNYTVSMDFPNVAFPRLSNYSALFHLL